MNIEGKIEPIVQMPQVERLSDKRSEAAKEPSNVQEDPTRVQISDVARDFSKAVQQLKADEQVRPEEVERGKEILKAWTEPTDEQVDVIINKLVDELWALTVAS